VVIPIRYALERSQWDEAATLQSVESQFLQVLAMGHFGPALGAARSGQPAAAATDITKLETLSKALSDVGDKYWAEQVKVQSVAATAWVADLEDASEKHIAMENRLFPMRELLGDMLLETGQPGAALAAYERR
jgi:hypothetical protein